MAIVYNMHVIVRGGGENRFLLFVFLSLKRMFPTEQKKHQPGRTK
jgi:hypothetical protein